MKRPFLALFIICFAVTGIAHSQTAARPSQPKIEKNDERAIASQALAALTRLHDDVVVYRSLGDFEDAGRLSRVSFETFQTHLQEVTAEVVPLLSRLRQTQLKSELTNALESYRDGAFYWRRAYEPRVIDVSALAYSERAGTPADRAFASSVPYTVVIYWRQAARYLKRANSLIS